MKLSQMVDGMLKFTKSNFYWKFPIIIWALSMVLIAAVGNDRVRSPINVLTAFVINDNLWLLYSLLLTIIITICSNFVVWLDCMGPGDLKKQKYDSDRRKYIARIEDSIGVISMKRSTLAFMIIEFVYALVSIGMVVSLPSSNGHFVVPIIISIIGLVMVIGNIVILHDINIIEEFQVDEVKRTLQS